MGGAGFAGQPNGPEITITRDGAPVGEDESGTRGRCVVRRTDGHLQTGGGVREDGNYEAVLVPTRPGTYEFHFPGTVEKEEIDEVFTSGPETFSDIEDPASIAFPVADPSTADPSERLERETVRLASDVEASGGSDTLARSVSIVASILYPLEEAPGSVALGPVGDLGKCDLNREAVARQIGELPATSAAIRTRMQIGVFDAARRPHSSSPASPKPGLGCHALASQAPRDNDHMRLGVRRRRAA